MVRVIGTIVSVALVAAAASEKPKHFNCPASVTFNCRGTEKADNCPNGTKSFCSLEGFPKGWSFQAPADEWGPLGDPSGCSNLPRNRAPYTVGGDGKYSTINYELKLNGTFDDGIAVCTYLGKPKSKGKTINQRALVYVQDESRMYKPNSNDNWDWDSTGGMCNSDIVSSNCTLTL